ncbi:MAG: RagB/SusD family nutrient uptake outer membrane protein [Bacteroidales bacterium]|nr:RagB/SusD family nutrient uptake outer membrane protein [Bacteroidales bacterium]
MKKILYILSAFVCLSLTFTSCDAIFDNLEGDLSKMSGADMASSEAGISRLLAQVYSYIPMNAFGVEDQYTMNACDSHGGDYGFNSNPYYGMYGVQTFWNWGAIRTINQFMVIAEEAGAAGTLTDAQAKNYIAEARFVRAYCYFVMVRNLGGVPIIEEPLDAYYNPADGNKELFDKAARATEQETWDWVIKEFQLAADDLPAVPEGYHASKYAALGMKARAALYAASVSKYWNAQGGIESTYKAVSAKKTYMDAGMANKYYKDCIDACEAIIGSGKFSLYGANPKSVAEAVKNLGDLFVTRQDCEFIFGRTLNDGNNTSGNAFDLDNSPAQTVTTNDLCGKYSVTIDFVDKFDNYDADRHAVNGTVKTRTDGKEDEYFTGTVTRFPQEYKDIPYVEYNSIDEPFVSKDARFQAWVLYPDCTFRNTVIKLQGGMIKTDGSVAIWADDSEEVGGTTYYAFGAPSGSVSGFFNYENKMAGKVYTTGFGLRKFLNPQSFQKYNKSFWYDIRYAEILLDYCEAVAESGQGNAASAKQYLNAIRKRAAFTDEVDLTVENVLHQRELELAFEGDQLYTLHRRRAFYNKFTDPLVVGQKHALTPILDLRSGSPKYIFVRSVHFAEDPLVGGKVSDYHTIAKSYYGRISDYSVNGYEPNPADE